MRIPACVLLGVIVSAPPADAQAAWVVWQKMTLSAPGKYEEQWMPVGAETSKQACELFVLRAYREVRPEPESPSGTRQTLFFTCLPDTVDPRGPKR